MEYSFLFISLCYNYGIMKIIDKRSNKDYYDYLSGIYGEDPKLILDRREGKKIDLFEEEKIVLFICGKQIEGFYTDGKIYYGEELLKIGERNIFRHWKRDDTDNVHIKYKRQDMKPNSFCYVNLKISEDAGKHNKKEDCPILYDTGYRCVKERFIKFPNLNNLGIPSLIPPEEMFKMLTEWLSNKITESENFIDNRSDVDKLLSKGFDKKESFRPKIKK